MWPFIIHSRKSVKAQGSVSNCLVSISDSIASKALLEHSKHQRVNYVEVIKTHVQAKKMTAACLNMLCVVTCYNQSTNLLPLCYNIHFWKDQNRAADDFSLPK